MAQRRIVLPLFFLFLFALPLVFATPFDDCKVLGNCQPTVARGGGGSSNITNINNYYNITGNNSEPLWNANFTAVVWNSSGLIKDWSWVLNGTGLIKDWNSTGYIKNWDPNGYIKDWNSTGFIKDWNMSGYITNWNNTGLILNWSNIITGGSGITNGSSAWLQNLSLSGDFLVDTTAFALFVNTTSHHVGINTNNPQNELNIIGELNVTNSTNIPLFSVSGINITMGNPNEISLPSHSKAILNILINKSTFVNDGIYINNSGFGAGVVSYTAGNSPAIQGTAVQGTGVQGIMTTTAGYAIQGSSSVDGGIAYRGAGELQFYNRTLGSKGAYFIATNINLTGSPALVNASTANYTSITVGMLLNITTQGNQIIRCNNALNHTFQLNTSGLYFCRGNSVAFQISSG